MVSGFVGALLAAIPLSAFAQTFGVGLVPGHDFQIMGDEEDVLWFNVTNTTAAGGVSINQVALHIPNSTGDNFARGITAPPGWSFVVNEILGNGDSRNDVTFTASAGFEIAPGASLVFQVGMQGDFNNPVPAAAANVTRMLSSIDARFTSTATVTLTNTPVWTRFALAVSAAASPASLATNGNGFFSIHVENRSTANQTTVQISPTWLKLQTANTGTATLGTPAPATLSLAVGASGTITVPFTNARPDSFFVLAKVQNGNSATPTVSSPEVASDEVSAGNLTARLVLAPVNAAAGDAVTVTMTVQNNTRAVALGNGTFSNTSIGMVQPGGAPVSIGGAAIACPGASVPPNVPSLASGQSATFTWSCTLSVGAAPLATYQVSGFAKGNGTNLSPVAKSNTGTVAAFSAFTVPASIDASSLGPVAVVIANGSAVAIAGEIWLEYPAGWVVAPAASQPAATGYTITLTTFTDPGDGTTRYRVVYTPNAGVSFDPGERLTLSNVYSTVAPPVGTLDEQAKIEVRMHETGTANQHGASAILVVTATKLTLSTAGFSAPFLLRKTASTIAGTFRMDQGSTATADRTTTTTSTKTGLNSVGWFPFSPGVSSIVALTTLPPATPTGKGWIVEPPRGATGITAGSWRFTVETDIPDNLTAGAAVLTVGLWKGTIAGGVFTPTGTILAPTDDPSGTDLRTSQNAVVTAVNITLPQVTLAANETLFVQYWRHQTVAVNTNTATRRELDFLVDDGVAKVEFPVATPFLPGPNLANGITTYSLVARMTVSGTPAAGELITLSTDAGTVSPASGATDANGNVAFTFTAPASTTDVTATITATRAGATVSMVVTFTGVTAGNLLYVGGSLYPRQVAPNTNVAFSINVFNAGGASITVTPADPTTFQFTDGTLTYQSTLVPGSVTVPAGGTAKLSFLTTPVLAAFALGTYFPTFSDPIPVNDAVTVTAAPTWASVVGFQAEAYGDGVRLSWSTDLEFMNTGFRVYRAQDGGEPVLVDGGWVPATGAAFSDYEFIDAPVGAGHWTYWIEDVDEDGTSTVHSPANVVLGAESGTGAVASAGTSPAAHAQTALFADDVWNDPADSGDVRVLARDTQSITYEITPPPFDAAPVMYPDGARDLLTIPRYGQSAQYGLPQLPLRQILVPAPLHASGRLEVLSVDETTLSGFHPAWYSGPSSAPDELTLGVPGKPGLKLSIRGGAPVAVAAMYPAAWAAVVDRGAMGDTEVVSLVAAPLRWEAANGLLHVARRIVARVTFEPAVAGASIASASAAENLQARILGGPSLEVSVSGAGLVRVPVSAIAASGAGSADSVAVYRRGVAIPSRVAGADLVFVADAPRSPWSSTTAWWIAPRAGAEPVLALPGAAPAAGASASLVRHGFHAEQDSVYGPLSAQGSGADRWYWTQVQTGGGAATVSVAVPEAVPGVASTLDVTLQGMYADATASPDHRVRVTLNGADLGVVLFDGYARARATLAVPSGVLVQGANALSLADESTSPSRVALDSADVAWDAPADAAGAPSLVFRTLSAGSVTATGFAEAPAFAIDETDPAHPSLLPIGIGGDAASGFTATVAAAPSRTIRLVTPSVPVAATWVARGAATNPLLDATGADYVVIAGEGLAPAASAFAEYRRTALGGSLRTTTVDATDLYDRFTFGDRDPEAMHRFLERAALEWPLPRPRYLLLVGDSTIDPKNLTASGVPTGLLLGAHIGTTLLDVASDNATAALGSGDGLPDLATGRIPARTPAEVAQMFAKTKAYESTPHDAIAAREVLLADDELPIFAVSASEAREMAQGGVQATMLSSAQSGAAASRTGLLQSIASGTALATYFGHGGIQTWGGEPYLSADDAAALSNPRLPVVLAVDCLNAYFDYPSADALGESLLRAPGGAAAVWASSAITADGGHLELANAFHHAFWREPGLRLGDVTRRALASIAYRGDAAELVGSYVLFGDPALRLAVNSAPFARASLVSVQPGSAELRAAGSWDPDGDTLAYRWEILQAPAGAMAHLDGASGANATLVADLPGRYRVRLRVADAHVAGPAEEVAIELPAAAAGSTGRGCDTTAPSSSTSRGGAAASLALLFAGALVVRARRER